VAAPRSRPPSLQLALENGNLEAPRPNNIKALPPLGEKDDDIVGYLFAVERQYPHADIYPSNVLFRKVWPQLLRRTTEALGGARRHRPEPAPPPPTQPVPGDPVGNALSSQKKAALDGRIEMRESDKTCTWKPAAAGAGDAWVHPHYLAKCRENSAATHATGKFGRLSDKITRPNECSERKSRFTLSDFCSKECHGKLPPFPRTICEEIALISRPWDSGE